MLVAGVPVFHTGSGGTRAERGQGCLPCQPLQLCTLLQDGRGCRSGPAHVTCISLFTLRCPKMPFSQFSRIYQNAPQDADLDLPMSPASVSSPSGAPKCIFHNLVESIRLPHKMQIWTSPCHQPQSLHPQVPQNAFFTI